MALSLWLKNMNLYWEEYKISCNKEKMLVTSIFSDFFIRLLSWGHLKSLLCGNELTHYQTTNFRLFQTETVCRRQFQIWRKWKKVIQTGRKHCGKRRNCLLLFPQCFQKACFPEASKGVIVWEWVNGSVGLMVSSIFLGKTLGTFEVHSK